MKALKLFALLVFCTVAILGLEWFVTRGTLMPILGILVIVGMIWEKAKEQKGQKK